MSAFLYIGGVLYLLAVIRTTGKRYDADFISWQDQMKRATYRSVLRSETDGQTQVRSKAA